MKFTHKSAKPTVPFSALSKGEVFMMEGDRAHYMKTERLEDCFDNICRALCLENGVAIRMDDDTQVHVIDCTLVCE